MRLVEVVDVVVLIRFVAMDNMTKEMVAQSGGGANSGNGGAMLRTGGRSR